MDEEVCNARGELSDGNDCFWTKLLVAYLVFYLLSVALVLAAVLMGGAPAANKQDDASHDAPLRLLGRI